MRRTLLLCAVILTLTVAAPADAQTFLKRGVNSWRDDLKKDDTGKRRSAAFALGQIGGEAAVALGDLLELVRGDKDAGVRDMAARAVGDVVAGLVYSVRPPRKPDSEWTTAEKPLVAALADSDPRVRRSAAYALGTFGDTAIKALPSLRTVLRDPAPMVKQNAAWAVGKLGDSSEETMRELAALLSDDSPLVRRLTATALGELNARPAKRSRPKWR